MAMVSIQKNFLDGITVDGIREGVEQAINYGFRSNIDCVRGTASKTIAGIRTTMIEELKEWRRR